MAFAISDEMLAIFLPTAVYWIYSGIYTILGMYLEKYRLHSKREEEEKNLVSRSTVIKGVLTSQAIYALMLIFLFKVGGGNDGAKEEQPTSFLVKARQFVVAMLVFDTYQYFTHRWMHQNMFLYRHFHAAHHRLTVPYAFGAFYGNKLGILFVAVSGYLSVLLSGMSLQMTTIFFCFTTIKFIDEHCGMMLPGNPFHMLFGNHAAFHEVHHQLKGAKYNFSEPYFVMWDKIMGTYMPYSVEKRSSGGFEARATGEFKDD